MRASVVFVLVAATGMCHAQNTTPQPSPHGPDATSTSAIQAGDVIVTIHNVCEPPSATPCQTQLTRAQFESLFRTVSVPNAPFPIPTASAEKYARALALAQEARKENLDKDPSIQAQMHLFETQLLASAIQKKIQADEANVSSGDIQKYYAEHRKQFEEISVRTVMIPSPSQSPANSAQAASSSTENPAARSLAETARGKLLAGEDSDKVEKEVFALAQITSPPPVTSPAVRHRNPYFPAPEEDAIFGMNVGEVSVPIPRGDGGFTVYKLESKRLMPLDAVSSEIQKVIATQRVGTRINGIAAAQKTDLDPRYFKGEKAEREAIELQQKKEREESER